MKKSIRNGIAFGLLLVTSASVLASCGGGSTKGKGVYTYRTAMSASPETWNVHNWQTNTDSVIMGYTEMGLYDFILNEEKNGYAIVPEMAKGEPKDDSSSITDAEEELYGVDKLEEGTKWVIDLNPDAVWENGDPINADTYLYSMEKMLSPEMNNFRASSYYSGSVALANAEGYYKSGKESLKGLADLNSTDDRVDNVGYFSAWEPFLLAPSYTLGGLAADYASSCPLLAELLKDTNTYGTAKEPKAVPFTSSNMEAIAAAVEQTLNNLFGGGPFEVAPTLENTGNFTLYHIAYAKVKNPVVTFDQVGIKKTGEYQIALYLVNPASLFDLKYNLSGNWIVHKETYEKSMKQVGTIKATEYGTSLSNYMSYGPYKLTGYQLDKSITLAKNDTWYGYTDGEHEGQFQTTNIDIQIVKNEDTMLLMFESGEIDDIALRPQDLEKYRTSSQLRYTPQSYTTKFTLNSNWDALRKRQTSGVNKTILSNVKFREALSWSVDRETLAQTETAGSSAYVVPINRSYVSDVDAGTKYRDTEQGKAVIKNVFGDNESGYDHDKAVQLVNEAVQEELASTREGHLLETDVVELYWEIYNEGWATMIDFIIKGFEKVMNDDKCLLKGKFRVTRQYDENYTDHNDQGLVDICMSTWGGATMDPFGIVEVYISPSYKYEYGFDPSTKLTINVNGVDETMTYTEWMNALMSGKYSAARADNNTRVTVLAGIEEGLIRTWNFVSIYARRSVTMDSFKIKQGCDEYVELVGYGGIRFLTYNYDDAEWTSRVKKGLDYSRGE